MKSEDFEALLERRTDQMNLVLASKAIEYSHRNDRLYNFKRAAKITETTTSEALWGMAVKHLVSVQDIVSGYLDNNARNVDEKVGDLINYLVLLEAALQEERENVLI